MTDVRQVAAEVLGTIMTDEPWQDLGFPKRPRHGAMIQRLRPQWRVNFEKAVLKEMVVVFTAAHVAAGRLDAQRIDEIASFYAGGPRGTRDVWRTLGYSSRSEAELHLAESIRCYADVRPADWSTVLGERLGVLQLDPRIAFRTLTGVVAFAQTVEEWVRQMRPGQVF